MQGHIVYTPSWKCAFFCKITSPHLKPQTRPLIYSASCCDLRGKNNIDKRHWQNMTCGGAGLYRKQNVTCLSNKSPPLLCSANKTAGTCHQVNGWSVISSISPCLLHFKYLKKTTGSIKMWSVAIIINFI